jgi:hypothetical protein
MGLWIAAIVVGRKGETARAAFLEAGETKVNRPITLGG